MKNPDKFCEKCGGDICFCNVIADDGMIYPRTTLREVLDDLRRFDGILQCDEVVSYILDDFDPDPEEIIQSCRTRAEALGLLNIRYSGDVPDAVMRILFGDV